MSRIPDDRRLDARLRRAPARGPLREAGANVWADELAELRRPASTRSTSSTRGSRRATSPRRSCATSLPSSAAQGCGSRGYRSSGAAYRPARRRGEPRLHAALARRRRRARRARRQHRLPPAAHPGAALRLLLARRPAAGRPLRGDVGARRRARRSKVVARAEELGIARRARAPRGHAPRLRGRRAARHRDGRIAEPRRESRPREPDPRPDAARCGLGGDAARGAPAHELLAREELRAGRAAGPRRLAAERARGGARSTTGARSGWPSTPATRARSASSTTRATRSARSPAAAPTSSRSSATAKRQGLA